MSYTTLNDITDGKIKECLACGSSLLGNNFNKDTEGYCDYKCYQAKTPKMIEVEREFNEDLRVIIVNKLSRTDNIMIVAGLLGVSRSTLYKWIDKFGIERTVEWR